MGSASDCHQIPIKISMIGHRTASENAYFSAVRPTLIDTRNVGFFFPPWEMSIQRQKLQYLIVVFAKSDSFFQCLSLSLSAERIPLSLPSYDDGQEMLLDGVKISLLAQGMEWTLKNWGGFEAAVEHFSSTRRILLPKPHFVTPAMTPKASNTFLPYKIFPNLLSSCCYGSIFQSAKDVVAAPELKTSASEGWKLNFKVTLIPSNHPGC